MARTENVKRNFVFNVIKMALQLLLQFVLRTVLIYVLGKEYIGLNGLFTNILGLLNLVELGIGGAIVFSLYKPIAEKNDEKIKALVALYKKFYAIIAFVVLGLGLVAMLFLPYLIQGEAPANVNIYIVYAVYLFNTFVSYFAAHKRSLIFANQRNDIESKIRIVCISALNVLQIVLLLVFKNYYYYIILMPIFTLIESILIKIEADKHFPIDLKNAGKLDDETKSELKKKIYAMSLHQLASALVLSTDNILISAIFGLSAVGVYSNYLLIITSIISIIGLITTSLQASVGNMIATTNPDYVFEKYKMLNLLFTWFIGFCSICFLCLFQPFILLWTKDSGYLFEFIVVVALVVSFYLKESLGLTVMFKTTAQLVWHDRFSPLVQGITNIVCSILFAYIFGIVGIFMGTIVSTLVAPFWWAPRTLYKHYFNKGLKNYWCSYLLITAFSAVVAVVMYILCDLMPAGLGWFVVRVVACVLIPNLLFLLSFRNIGIIEFAKEYLWRRRKISQNTGLKNSDEKEQ